MSENREELRDQIQTIKAIRAELDLNRKEFSEYMGIPLRTLEEWESGRRKMPDYVLRLIVYYARMEQFIKEKGIDFERDMK